VRTRKDSERIIKDSWIASIADPFVQLAAWSALESHAPSRNATDPARVGSQSTDGLRRLVLMLLGRSGEDKRG
jgi:hypothetical protein